MSYADGQELETEHYHLNTKQYTMTKGVHEKLQSQPMTAFTAAEKTLLKGEIITIAILFNPITGKVMESFYSFAYTGGKVTYIPPSTFRKLDLALSVDGIVVQPTEWGRRLNYMFAAYNIYF